MAELQSSSAVLKPLSSAISTTDHRSFAFFEQPMSDSEVERGDASTALQSRYFASDGERGSFQFEAVLSPGPSFKRAKWDNSHSEITFTRLPAGETSSTLTATEETFACPSPSSRYQFRMPTSTRVNGNLSLSTPVQESVSPACQQRSPAGIDTTANATTPISGGASTVPRIEAPEPLHIDESSLAEALAELEKERQKNAELLGRLAFLEARLEEREKANTEGGDQVSGVVYQGALLDGSKQNKWRKKMVSSVESEEQDMKKNEARILKVKQEEGAQILEGDVRDGCNGQASAVTWMSREEGQLSEFGRPRRRDADSEGDEYVESDYTDDDYSSSEEDEEDDYDGNDDDVEIPTKETERRKTKRPSEGDISLGAQLSTIDASGKSFDARTSDKRDHYAITLSGTVISRDGEEDMKLDEKRIKRTMRRGERSKLDASNRDITSKRGLGYMMVPYKVHGMTLSQKKAPKVAFCPKEVKRIMESGVLALKNAQSHTMRKIIVFASLAICHGCEDLYELDFNHFSVIKRGEPYASSKNPGEHVLYDHPGIRRRIFYPNKQNPVLCPVCILDEERSMRPLGPSCPSCLFLCIKYGGSTRNLPQNEYVRQRMGRNKLKSFGPLMSQMALLVHIRTGSFFFKALGITLLFMAGFSDDLVRKETKYRNLDLLQKYYRSDEDAEGDFIFHPYPPFYPQALLGSPAVPARVAAGGSKATGKKQPPPILSKPPGCQTSTPLHLSQITRTLQGVPFGSAVFPSIAGVGPCPLQTVGSVTSPTGATCVVTSGMPAIAAATSGTLSPMFPPHYGAFPAYLLQHPSAGGFPPVPVWPPLSSFPPSHFSTPSYGYQAFAHATQYGSPPCYGNSFLPFPTASMKMDSDRKNHDSESDSDSESSSGGASQKVGKENSSNSEDA